MELLFIPLLECSFSDTKVSSFASTDFANTEALTYYWSSTSFKTDTENKSDCF